MSKRKFVYFWKYVFLILVAIISIFPMYWMIVSGTNKSVDVIVGKILPGNYLMENLKSLLDTTVLSQAMWNSIRNAVVSMVLNVFVCSLAGYGFEKFHDKYKDKIMSILLLSMMVPTDVFYRPFLLHLLYSCSARQQNHFRMKSLKQPGLTE